MPSEPVNDPDAVVVKLRPFARYNVFWSDDSTHDDVDAFDGDETVSHPLWCATPDDPDQNPDSQLPEVDVKIRARLGPTYLAK